MQVHLRGDSGFGTPTMYAECEQLNIQYTIGIGMNARLKKLSDSLRNRRFRNGRPPASRSVCSRRFGIGRILGRRSVGWWSSAKRTPRARTGAVVTDRTGATVLPGAAYDGYADRGESENRNKELKVGLLADRLSDHRYFANLFRLYLHTTAYNLLVRMRRAVADPPQEVRSEEVPVEAFAGRERRGWHNRRRERDPLGEGQPCTWQTGRSRLPPGCGKRRVVWWWNSRPVGPTWTTSSALCDASWPVLRPP